MRDRQKTARWVTAIGLASALALGACRTDRELTEPEPIPVTEELLAGAVLTDDDLPAEFTPVEGAGTSISEEVLPEHECDDDLTKLTPELEASADFTRGNETIRSTTAWFPGQGGDAEQLFRDVAERCEQVVAADAGVSIRAGALDFGVLSDDTLAIRFEIEPTTGPIEERDVIVMRRGDLLTVIRLDGLRPSNKPLLDQSVRVLIGRLGLLHDDTT